MTDCSGMAFQTALLPIAAGYEIIGIAFSPVERYFCAAAFQKRI
jgi:hypothetical protein